jgi:hypothetical protein
MRFSIVKQKGHSMDETAATQTFSFIGRKSTGKTYAAGKLFEELYKIGDQVIAIDPIGNWRSVRLDASGKKPGLPIPVLGGRHGDIPLAVESGELVAQFLISKRISAVLDVSHFNKASRKRFVADFASALFDAAKEREDGVCTVFFEEAQLFAPQFSKGEERMLGAVEDIVRLGRNYGIGSVLITQRPQSVSKEVLNQVECLFVGQLNGAHERKAIGDWIVSQGVDLEGYVRELPSLKRGEFFMWSPSWLETFAKVKIRRKETFDGSATPRLGKSAKPMKLAPVDIKELSAALQETTEVLQANDPKALRAQIVRLERELRDAKNQPAVEQRTIDIQPIEEMLDGVVAVSQMIDRVWAQIAAYKDGRKNVMDSGPRRPVTPKALAVTVVQPPAPKFLPEVFLNQKKHEPFEPGNFGKLSKCALAILSVLKTHRKEMTLDQIAILSGYSARSGGFATAVAYLRSNGMINGTRSGISITKAGEHAAPEEEALPTGEELVTYWEKQLDSASGRVLRLLWRNNFAALSRLEIAKGCGYSPTSGGFATAMAKLNRLNLIEKAGGTAGGFRIAQVFNE